MEQGFVTIGKHLFIKLTTTTIQGQWHRAKPIKPQNSPDKT